MSKVTRWWQLSLYLNRNVTLFSRLIHRQITRDVCVKGDMVVAAIIVPLQKRHFVQSTNTQANHKGCLCQRWHGGGSYHWTSTEMSLCSVDQYTGKLQGRSVSKVTRWHWVAAITIPLNKCVKKKKHTNKTDPPPPKKWSRVDCQHSEEKKSNTHNRLKRTLFNYTRS